MELLKILLVKYNNLIFKMLVEKYNDTKVFKLKADFYSKSHMPQLS